MRIDAHQHYWKIDRGDYGWITEELPVLYRDFLPTDLKPSLQKHRLDGTVAVQAAPTWEETEFLLRLADEDASILGVVGWQDLFDPHHREKYEEFCEHPKYKGFRLMIQDMPDANAILAPEYIEALSWYESQDTPIDLLVKESQLGPLTKLMEKVPNLRGVIDHIAKPRIAAGEMEPWLEQMRVLAGYENLSCKLSGMVTEADPRHWQLDDFTAYVRAVCELFGPNRVMFGSDWPVCLLAASYDEMMEILEHAIPQDWTSTERARLFGLNAQAFYKL